MLPDNNVVSNEQRRFPDKSVFSSLRRCKHDTARSHPPCCYGYESKTGRACCRRAVQQSIDIAYLRGPQQQTRRKLLQRVNGTQQTDTVPLHRLCRILYASSVNKFLFSLVNSVVNMALPAFAAERRAAAPGTHRCLAVNQYLLPRGVQQQTRRTLPLMRSNDGTDGRTDGRTPDTELHILRGQCQQDAQLSLKTARRSTSMQITASRLYDRRQSVI